MTARPTSIRYLILFATALVSIFMYVDRVCLAGVKGDIQRELGISSEQMDWVLSAFFWSYALAQVFAGAVGGRFGLRNTLSAYLFLWSLFTVLTGLASGFALLFTARLLVGISEAGAYPTMATLVKAWFPVSRRGFANSMVALGGRFGGALGQRITPLLVIALAGVFALGGWRITLVIFGMLGMIYSLCFWILSRDSARQHPWANAAEAELVTEPAGTSKVPFPWRAILTSRNLWLSGLTQFGINLGWAFLITQWPDYLEKQHGLTGEDKGYWAAWPLTIGMVGMFLGGFITDALARRLGVRWGRALPIGVSLLACAIAYALCTQATDVGVVVMLLCIVTVFVDVGVPAIWAFAQDIGGNSVGPALGWGNMLGNIGAAVCPVLLGAVQRQWGWNAVFSTCAGAFTVSMILALNMNARIPLIEVHQQPKSE